MACLHYVYTSGNDLGPGFVTQVGLLCLVDSYNSLIGHCGPMQI